MNMPFELNGIKVGLSEDKQQVKVDLYSTDTNVNTQGNSEPYCSFIIPSISYNTLILAFLKAGKSMAESGAKLDLSELEMGDKDEEN